MPSKILLIAAAASLLMLQGIAARAESRGFTKDVVVLLPSPLVPIEGSNAEALDSLILFFEQRDCARAAGGGSLAVTGYAREGAPDTQIAAARAGSVKVFEYLAARAPSYVKRIDTLGVAEPLRGSTWNDSVVRSALSGAVGVQAVCMGIS
ncbi:hypothetical protein Q9L58_010780 [Maublancomyces gigas]|uniref:Uncharacterized protein n=1 Tax=Discina gigas TaxID=1032678 RepID=A0ABR3G363_9PEZI